MGIHAKTKDQNIKMPRPRHKLEEEVRTLIALNPTLTPDGIYDVLMEVKVRLGVTEEELPKPVTIGRIKRRFPDNERAPYTFVRFPETFDLNLLPWEAAADVLELWRTISYRPAVRLAQRYWHVTLALARDREQRPPMVRFALAAQLLDKEGEPGAWERILISLTDKGDPRQYAVAAAQIRTLADNGVIKARWAIDWDTAIAATRENQDAADE
jgi:hypothetical protein